MQLLSLRRRCAGLQALRRGRGETSRRSGCLPAFSSDYFRPHPTSRTLRRRKYLASMQNMIVSLVSVELRRRSRTSQAENGCWKQPSEIWGPMGFSRSPSPDPKR
jgi:hypothetical protein